MVCNCLAQAYLRTLLSCYGHSSPNNTNLCGVCACFIASVAPLTLTLNEFYTTLITGLIWYCMIDIYYSVYSCYHILIIFTHRPLSASYCQCSDAHYMHTCVPLTPSAMLLTILCIRHSPLFFFLTLKLPFILFYSICSVFPLACHHLTPHHLTHCHHRPTLTCHA